MNKDKVIVITRGKEYNSEDVIYEQCAQREYTALQGKIHEYIARQFEKAIIASDKERYKQLISELDGFPAPQQYRTEYTALQNAGTEKREYFKWLYDKKINPLLVELLKEKGENIKARIDIKAIKKTDNEPDNRPYVQFTTNQYDVYIMFLDRIFGTFFRDKDKFVYLVDNDNRMDFIAAICKDCGITENLENKNILYIHDMEWYRHSESYTSLWKGNFSKNSKLEEQKLELKNYFSTIKVFQHIQHPIFDEIKKMNFTEKDEDLEILERKFY
jgi:hypothetical protein